MKGGPKMASPAPSRKSERTDWYQEVTDSVIAQMEEALADNRAWKQSWQGLWKLGLPLRSDGETFSGINIWLLAMAAHKKGYTDPRWYTFNQAKEACGYRRNPEWKSRKDTYKGIPKFLWVGDGDDPKAGIRSGEKGTHVIRVSRIPVYEDSNGNRVYPPKKNAPKAVKDSWKARLASGEVRVAYSYFHASAYVVFNAEQIDGLPNATVRSREDRFAQAESLIDILGLNLVHLPGCKDAAYSPKSDQIVMPEPEQFESEEHYWATLLHETGHWTGHSKRLDRDQGRKGTDEYAFEELVAELSSAFLCAHLGIEGDLRHPEYLAHWVKRLKDDKKAIVFAASRAQTAMDYILSGGDAFAGESSSDSPEGADAHEQAA